MLNLLSTSSLSKAVSLLDLTNPRQIKHAMQLLIEEIHSVLAKKWQCDRQLLRTSPVVLLENNYDRLGYPPDGASRDARYTRYITEELILRTQTSAAIPDILEGLSVDPPRDVLLILPGIVYRRDSIDRLHCGEPHQLDLWRITHNHHIPPMTTSDLHQMIELVMNAALPDMQWRMSKSPHPYTEQGVQIDVNWHNDWVEVGECGLASQNILNNAGLHQHSGLAMGLGLDRLLMLRKNIPDIRLLRSSDSRIRAQMIDLMPYQSVSNLPAIQRDLSLCVDNSLSDMEIGDKIRNELPQIDCVESISILSDTDYMDLPASAHRRMGMHPGQKNILLRLTIRHMSKTLTDAQANSIRNAIYLILHEGNRREIAENQQD